MSLTVTHTQTPPSIASRPAWRFRTSLSARPRSSYLQRVVFPGTETGSHVSCLTPADLQHRYLRLEMISSASEVAHRAGLCFQQGCNRLLFLLLIHRSVNKMSEKRGNACCYFKHPKDNELIRSS